jgi:hypothetical protein
MYSSTCCNTGMVGISMQKGALCTTLPQHTAQSQQQRCRSCNCLVLESAV